MCYRGVFGIGLLVLGVASPPVSGHPHVFVDVKAGFRVEEGDMLTGLHIVWTYDPFTTLFLFDVLDLDRDGDGALNQHDKAAILRGETEWPEDYVGDIYLEVDAKPSPHLTPQHAYVRYEQDQISVGFDLPLAEPVAIAGREVVLRLYDPAYYYAYTVTQLAQPVPLPAHCAAVLQSFEPDEAASELMSALGTLSREETPAQENVGRLFSDKVMLKCQ